MIYLTAFIAMLLFVGLKAFQQLNVMHDKFLWVFPISWGLGFCEVYVVGAIAIESIRLEGFAWMLALTIGTAGGCGSVLSMLIHRRCRRA